MILFAGDPHGSFDHLYPFLKTQQDVALVILGDLQLTTPEPLEKLAQLADLRFIQGNHHSKTVEAFEALWGTEWKQPMFFDPIHYCQYCSQERIWRGGVPLRHRTSIFPSDIEALETQQADILICHEAPKPHPSGFAVINQLAEKMGVQQIYHGHHHENFDYAGSKHHYQIINVGFRSLCDEAGRYLYIGVDDRGV